MKNKILIMTFACFLFGGVQLSAQQTKVSELGEAVKYELAKSWIDQYNAQQVNEVRGHVYGSIALKDLINQTGVEGIKIYNAMDADGVRKIVFQGLGSLANEVGLAYDISRGCPPFCGSGDDVAEIESIGEAIDSGLAQEMINRFNLIYPTSPSSYSFSAGLVQEILDQPSAKGMFLAYGIEGNNRSQLVLIGMNKEGSLMTDGTVAANAQVGYNSLLSAQK